MSHILIRHDQTPYTSVSFQLSDWHWPGLPSTRSRADALRLAQDLRERAVRAPEHFAELVREFTEDPATRDVGGYLGGITADQLTIEPQLLDALQVTRLGEVAPVVETRWGFHVLLSNQPPTNDTVSGTRIIIGHEQAPWLGQSYMARGELVPRSREDALALATRIYDQARAEPERFEQLVQAHSEHLDASRGGDFGTWSTREPTQFPREVAALRRLAPGEIAAPMDSLFGFQILRRTSDRPRTVYRMAAIRMMLDESAPDGAPESAPLVLEKMRALYAEVQRDPARFDRLREELCCTKVSQVIAGRNPELLIAALDPLQPGQMAPEPVKYGPAYLIPKLLARDVFHASPTAQLALPDPAEIDLDYWVPQLDATALQERLRAVGEQVRALPGLSAETSAELANEHGRAAQLRELSGAERAQRLGTLRERVVALLAEGDARRYRELFDGALTELAHNVR